MTKSKTKLVTLDRKTSVKKSVIKKAVEKVMAEKGLLPVTKGGYKKAS